MILHSPSARPADPVVAEAARRLAGTARPLGLGAWREISRTGALPGDPEPDVTATGLVRRWHQHLAVAIDVPMERLSPGEDRLPALVAAWLDLARRTGNVRRHVAATAGPLARAEALRQRTLLAGLLAEDLAVLGAVDPRRAALDLLGEMEQVAAAEDASGRELRSARRALLPTAEAPRPRMRCRLVGRLRPAAV
jgi:hypothetical protein